MVTEDYPFDERSITFHIIQRKPFRTPMDYFFTRFYALKNAARLTIHNNTQLSCGEPQLGILLGYVKNIVRTKFLLRMEIEKKLLIQKN